MIDILFIVCVFKFGSHLKAVSNSKALPHLFGYRRRRRNVISLNKALILVGSNQLPGKNVVQCCFIVYDK